MMAVDEVYEDLVSHKTFSLHICSAMYQHTGNVTALKHNQLLTATNKFYEIQKKNYANAHDLIPFPTPHPSIFHS